jgi:hypothetical protein
MFKISQKPTYSWPVTVNLPVDGGKFEKQTFDAEFKRLTQSQIKAHLEANASDFDFGKDVLVGWKGVTDDSGAEVPFSESSRDQLLEIPAVSSAVTVAFYESIAGAKRKN